MAMGVQEKLHQKVVDAAATILDEGEHLVGSVHVRSKSQAVGAALGGLVGHAVGSRMSRRDGGSPIPTAGAMFVGATENRLLVWESGGALTAKPQRYLGDRLFDELATVEQAKSAISPTAMGLLITDRDGGSVKLEGQRKGIRAFVEAVAPHLAKT
jgi:hypothetical protein